MSYLFLRPRPWQFEIWDSTDTYATYLLAGFDTLNLKFCDLKLWKLTVHSYLCRRAESVLALTAWVAAFVRAHPKVSVLGVDIMPACHVWGFVVSCCATLAVAKHIGSRHSRINIKHICIYIYIYIHIYIYIYIYKSRRPPRGLKEGELAPSWKQRLRDNVETTILIVIYDSNNDII